LDYTVAYGHECSKKKKYGPIVEGVERHGSTFPHIDSTCYREAPSHYLDEPLEPALKCRMLHVAARTPILRKPLTKLFSGYGYQYVTEPVTASQLHSALGPGLDFLAARSCTSLLLVGGGPPTRSERERKRNKQPILLWVQCVLQSSYQS
jgi:hypothetical protein